MADFHVYGNKDSVKARQVTTTNGEWVVTSLGPTWASKGDYVTLRDDNGTREFNVVPKADFEARYSRKQSRSRRKVGSSTVTSARESTPAHESARAATDK